LRTVRLCLPHRDEFHSYSSRLRGQRGSDTPVAETKTLMRGTQKHIFRWVWARRTTAAVFLLLLVLGRYEWFPWLKGNTAATTVCRIVPFADPLAAIEVTLATRRAEIDLLVGAGVLLAFGVLAGPVFCGWVCPLGLLLDLNDALRRGWTQRLHRGSWLVRGLRVPAEIKYGFLGLALGFALVARLPAFQTLSPINIVAWAIVFSAWPALLVVGALVAVEHIASRVWCRSLCPLGALYSLVGRYGLLRVRVDPARAGKLRCERCTQSCPMGIRVTEDYVVAGKSAIDHPDCTRCGACVDACPSGALRLGMRATRDTSGVSDHTTPGADTDVRQCRSRRPGKTWRRV